MINIHLGEIVRGRMDDDKRLEHINIQVPYHIFRETVIGEQIKRDLFIGWINKELYSAIGPTGKITIELTR